MKDHLPILLLAILGAAAYLDLKGDLRALRPPADTGATEPDATPQGGDPGPAETPSLPKPAPNPATPEESPSLDWSCTGRVDEAALREGVKILAPRIVGCGTFLDEGVSGLVNLSLRVADGRVTGTRLSGPLQTNEVVSACLIDAAESWQPPNVTGDACAVIRLPFQLSREPEQ